MPGTVLMITYEFPPSGGGGVQRVAKFAKYLPESGWRPVVVAAEPIPGRPRDDSLVDDVGAVPVRRVPARHVPTAIARGLRPLKRLGRGARPAARASGTPAAPRQAASSRLSRWVALPDDAALWIAPATSAAIELGRAEGADAVFASGPPFSALVAGARVARTLGVPFVADMRDPWDRNVSAYWPTTQHRDASRRYERDALGAADHVLAVSPPIAEEALDFGAPAATVVPNGFDRPDMPPHRPEAGAPLHLVFVGRMYHGMTDPRAFLEGLVLASRALDPPPLLTVVGTAEAAHVAAVDELGLAEQVRFLGYLPHAEALERASRADVGLVLIADRPGSEAVFTGKLFEYLGMGLPVLVCGPPSGAAAELVTRAGAGVAAPPSDTAAVAEAIIGLAQRKERGESLSEPDGSVIAGLDRRVQAGELARVLDAAVSRAGGGGRSTT